MEDPTKFLCNKREHKYKDIISRITDTMKNDNCVSIKDACVKCNIDYRQYFLARDFFAKPVMKGGNKSDIFKKYNEEQSQIKTQYANNIENIFAKKNNSEKKPKKYEVYEPKPLVAPAVPSEFKK
jgi:hypothetical protein